MHSDLSNGPNSTESFPHYQGILNPKKEKRNEYGEQEQRNALGLGVNEYEHVGAITKWVVSSLNSPG